MVVGCRSRTHTFGCSSKRAAVQVLVVDCNEYAVASPTMHTQAYYGLHAFCSSRFRIYICIYCRLNVSTGEIQEAEALAAAMDAHDIKKPATLAWLKSNAEVSQTGHVARRPQNPQSVNSSRGSSNAACSSCSCISEERNQPVSSAAERDVQYTTNVARYGPVSIDYELDLSHISLCGLVRHELHQTRARR